MINTMFVHPPSLDLTPTSYFTATLKAHQWIKKDLGGVLGPPNLHKRTGLDMRRFLAWTENGPAWTRLGWCLDSAWTARGNILLSSWWPVWWAIFQRSSHPLKAFTQKKPWRNLYQGKKKKVGSPRQWLCGCGVANPDLDLSLPDSGRLRSQVRIAPVHIVLYACRWAPRLKPAR